METPLTVRQHRLHLLSDEELDWTKDSDEEIQPWEGEITNVQSLSEILEEPPAMVSDLSEAFRDGPAFLTKGGKPRWRRCHLLLVGDQLYCKPSTVVPIIF